MAERNEIPNRMTALGLLEQMRRSNANRQAPFDPVAASARERRAAPVASSGQRPQAPLPLPPTPPTVIPPPQAAQAHALPVPPQPPAVIPRPEGSSETAVRFNLQNPYVATANQMAERYGLPPNVLLSLLHQESRFNPNAVSRAGALGIGQLMPGTAAELGVDPRNPTQNIEGSARYLRQQLDRFGGDMRLALAAYNAGPRRVVEAGNEIPNNKETQAYVPTVMRNAGVPGYAHGGLAHLEHKYAAGDLVEVPGVATPIPGFDYHVRATRIRQPRAHRPAPREELTANQLNDMVLDRIAGRAAPATEVGVPAEARERIGRTMGYDDGGLVQPYVSGGGSGTRVGNSRIVGYGGNAGLETQIGGGRFDTSISGQGMSSHAGGHHRQHHRVEGVNLGYTTPSGDRFTLGFHDRLMAPPDTLPGANPMEIERGMSPSRGVRVGFSRAFADGGLAELEHKYAKGGLNISDEEYDRRLRERLNQDARRTFRGMRQIEYLDGPAVGQMTRNNPIPIVVESNDGPGAGLMTRNGPVTVAVETRDGPGAGQMTRNNPLPIVVESHDGPGSGQMMRGRPVRPVPREELTADQLNGMVLDRIAGRAAPSSEVGAAAEARDRIRQTMGYAEGGLAELDQRYADGGPVMSDEEYDRRLLSRMKTQTGRTTESTNAEQAQALRNAGYDAAQLASDIFMPQSPLDAALMVAMGPGPRLARLAGSAALAALEPSEAEAGGLRRLIRAYHGSPHRFDEFDIRKVGTGEGNQAFGRGLYFAEDEGVAKHYRDTLSQPSNLELLEHFNRHGSFPPERGHMYEVNLHASPRDFLNWDAPLSRQAPEVRESLQRFGLRVDPDAVREYDDALLDALHNDPFRPLPARPRDPTGQEIYQNNLRMDPEEARVALMQAGIPGTRYFDAGSRGIGSGTSNYAVFDPEIIDITRRYAHGGLAQLEHKYADGGIVNGGATPYDPDAVNALANQIEAGYV